MSVANPSLLTKRTTVLDLLSPISTHARIAGAAATPPTIDQLEAVIERLAPKLRIAVIFGGDKSVDGAVINQSANPRSWKSYEVVANDIAAALGRLGFRHVGLFPDDMRLGEQLRQNDIDLVWLNTGGVQGYDPMAHAPSMMELFGIPYVGHDPLTVGTLDNKHAFKRDLVCLGLPTAPFITWHLARGPFRPQVNSRFARAFKDHWGPYVVKPVSGRASLHVHVVDDVADLPEVVAEVYHATQNHVLIEAFLPGREFCIAASGPITARGGHLMRRSEPFVFSPVERVLQPGERFATSMDLRPITQERVRPLDPSQDFAVIAQLNEIGRQVYLDFHLEALIRLDVRADAAGKLYILEANPKPDLKHPTGQTTNLICAGLSAYGMTYDDLVLSLLATRLDFLLTYRPTLMQRVQALLA